MVHPESITEFSESTQIVIKKIHNRIESGKNALCIVVGPTGSGKSLSALQIMRGLYLYRYGKDPTNEYMLDHVSFKAKDFMEKMNSDNLKKGEAWMWDEAGVDVGHKSHATIQNRIVGWLAQTFRHLQQIVFFTTPSIAMIDASVRKLLHYYFEAMTIDKKENACYIKPLQLQYNVRMDKLYYHNFTYPTKQDMIEVDLMMVPKVNDDLEKLYEEKKNQFTRSLNLRIQDMLHKIDVKESGLDDTRLTDRQRKILELMKQGIIRTGEIARRLDTKDYAISENLRFLRNKGYDIDKIREESKKLVVLGQKIPVAT